MPAVSRISLRQSRTQATGQRLSSARRGFKRWISGIWLFPAPPGAREYSVLALGERCTDGATARSDNGDQDRDRGRPVLFVRPVRVVPVTSSNLAILDFFFVAASATAYVLGNCCAELRGTLQRPKDDHQSFLPPILFDEPATAVAMRRSPSSSDQRGDLQTRRELLLPWEALKASDRPKLN